MSVIHNILVDELGVLSQFYSVDNSVFTCKKLLEGTSVLLEDGKLKKVTIFKPLGSRIASTAHDVNHHIACAWIAY